MSGFRIRQLGPVLFLLLLNTAFAEKLVVTGIPDGPVWQNIPAASHVEHGAKLTIRSGKATDRFIDPWQQGSQPSAHAPLYVGEA